MVSDAPEPRSGAESNHPVSFVAPRFGAANALRAFGNTPFIKFSVASAALKLLASIR